MDHNPKKFRVLSTMWPCSGRHVADSVSNPVQAGKRSKDHGRGLGY